jgi:transposase
MPPSLQEWLPEDHLAYFVSELVDDLNLSEVEALYEDEERGQPPYHPKDAKLAAELKEGETRSPPF